MFVVWFCVMGHVETDTCGTCSREKTKCSVDYGSTEVSSLVSVVRNICVPKA